MIGFPLVITVSDRDMSGIEPQPLGWHNSALTNELQEVFISPKLELPRKGFDFPTSGETLPCVKSFNSKKFIVFL